MISDPKILELLKQLAGEGVQINESSKTLEEREENLFIELLKTVPKISNFTKLPVNLPLQS
jgi:hypothetical protein